MKTFTGALDTFLNGLRSDPDVTLFMSDLYTFTLLSGSTLRYTNSDISIVYGGNTYDATSILIGGLKYKCAVGLEVDKQDIDISARSTDTISGSPFLQALRNGAFDGAEIQRNRVFFSDYIGGSAVGDVLLFKGRLGEIKEIGRTSAKLSVNSDLILLDIDMPRNIYQATCLHTLYDSGCTLNKAAFGTNGAALAGSTASVINWAGATTNFVQGSITFLTGTNAGVKRTVASAVAGVSISLIYPLETVPAAGDTFTVYWGCDHTLGTCTNKFANQVNFRGFPYVPPPQLAV